MEKTTLHLLAEPAYSSTHWFTSTVAGIYSEAAKKGFNVSMIDPAAVNVIENNAQAVFPDNLIMVLGTSITWVNEISSRLQKAGIRSILLGSDTQKAGQNISVVNLSHESACMDIVQYLMQTGRKHIAFVGANPESISDKSKLSGFYRALATFGLPSPDNNVFYNHGSILDCVDKFQADACEYDGAICSNDIVAITLIQKAQTFGLRVPEDLYIVGFGDTCIGKFIQPSLTTATLNYTEAGSRAVDSYDYLLKNPSVISQLTVVACQIIVRGTTQFRSAPNAVFINADLEQSSPIDNRFYCDSQVQGLLKLEELFQKMDEIDGRLLEGLFQNTKYEELSEKLNISESTIKYRMKKIMQVTGIPSRKQLSHMISGMLGENALAVFNNTFQAQGMWHSQTTKTSLKSCPKNFIENRFGSNHVV